VRVASKPGLDCGTAPIREQIHHLVGRKIDDHCPRGLAFAKGKIIHPNLGWDWQSGRLMPPQLPTQRRDRSGQLKTARQPVCRFMGGGRTQHQQRLSKPLGHTGSWKNESGKSFGKNATSTALLATEKASCPQQNTKRIASTGDSTKPPARATVLSR